MAKARLTAVEVRRHFDEYDDGTPLPQVRALDPPYYVVTLCATKKEEDEPLRETLFGALRDEAEISLEVA